MASVATTSGGIDTNDSLANLELTGNVFNINETSTNIRAQLRWRDYEFYGGDTWRVSPKVTFNYGVRYSLLLQPFQPDDQITSFQPQLYDPSAPSSDACNGLWVAPGKDPCGAANSQFGTNFSHGTPGPNRSLVNNGHNHFAPRVGVSYDAFGSGKTVIRAGVGQFFQRERVSRYTLVANAPFALTTNNYARTLGGATPSSLSGTASPSGGEDPNSNLPNSWQWNLAVEQQLAKNTIFQAAYVGNRGIHLTNSYDVNSIAPKQLDGGDLCQQRGGQLTASVPGGREQWHADVLGAWRLLELQRPAAVAKQPHRQYSSTGSSVYVVACPDERRH